LFEHDLALNIDRALLSK